MVERDRDVLEEEEDGKEDEELDHEVVIIMLFQHKNDRPGDDGTLRSV